MPSLSNLKRQWLLKSLGIADPQLKSEADLEALVYAEDRIAAAPIQGTGFPEGVVTAPVGTEYVDTDATAGAVKWVKATGVDNTGWKVSTGDTGWRETVQWNNGAINVGALNAGWKVRGTTSGYVRVRRINSIVLIGITNVAVATADTSEGVWTPPAGFVVDSPSGALASAVPRFTSADAYNALFLTTSLGRASNFGLAVDDYLIQVQVNYTTNDTWPSALPGNAVA